MGLYTGERDFTHLGRNREGNFELSNEVVQKSIYSAEVIPLDNDVDEKIYRCKF